MRRSLVGVFTCPGASSSAYATRRDRRPFNAFLPQHLFETTMIPVKPSLRVADLPAPRPIALGDHHTEPLDARWPTAMQMAAVARAPPLAASDSQDIGKSRFRALHSRPHQPSKEQL